MAKKISHIGSWSSWDTNRKSSPTRLNTKILFSLHKQRFLVLNCDEDRLYGSQKRDDLPSTKRPFFSRFLGLCRCSNRIRGQWRAFPTPFFGHETILINEVMKNIKKNRPIFHSTNLHTNHQLFLRLGLNLFDENYLFLLWRHSGPKNNAVER